MTSRASGQGTTYAIRLTHQEYQYNRRSPPGAPDCVWGDVLVVWKLDRPGKLICMGSGTCRVLAHCLSRQNCEVIHFA